MNKRAFLKKAAHLAWAPLLFSDLELMVQTVMDLSPKSLAKEEEFWLEIRKGYKLKSEYINLENGYYCITPQKILQAYIEHTKMMNLEGSFYMRTRKHEDKLKIGNRLADLVGAKHGEVIVTRNTTESLDTVISGYDWKSGDEAVWAVHDYGAMKNQFRYMEKRWGITNRIIEVPIDPQTDEEIVALYEAAITKNTKLLMVCHMINISGQILPVRKICDMAHQYNVDVMVDGAHTLAHLDFKIEDLNCDYYGASLHKWLSAPIGSGMLYVKQDKIEKLWPMFANHEPEGDSIYKLNHRGTHPPQADLAIHNAINYYEALGAQRKEQRLRYLQNYWRHALEGRKKIRLYTPQDNLRSCGIGNIGIEGIHPTDMAKKLLSEHGIWTVAIDNHGIQGCRITPNIYTTTKELDHFIDSIISMAN
jgi:selenocysteine lyase/cysteine desulfurase